MTARLSHTYITRIELENIRGFKHLTVNLLDESSSDGLLLNDLTKSIKKLSIIIGRNGTNKSTLLRCIALAMCDVQDVNALLSQPNAQLVTTGKKEGSIFIQYYDPSSQNLFKRRLILRTEKGRDYATPAIDDSYNNPPFFACGYGAGRGSTGEATTRSSYLVSDSVRSLFDYDYPLLNSELILRRLEDSLGKADRYDNALAGIKRVMGLEKHHKIEFYGGGISISGPDIGEDIPLDGWADGYRMTFKWIIDLYGRAIQADAIDDDGNVQGILLIDEIEQHLHPSMQSELVANLRNALPAMQIFASTHSPLTTLGTAADNIIALHRKESGVHRANIPSLIGFSAEDVLVESALFGTSPYSSTTQDKIDRYNEIKTKQPESRTSQEVEELNQLASELNPDELPTTPADDSISSKLDELTELLKKGREL